MNNGIKAVATILQAEDWEIAFGTGTTPEWVDNATLEAEYARGDATVTLLTTDLADDTLNFHLEYMFTEIKTVSEYGVFHKTSGLMLCRKVRTPVTGRVGYVLDIDYQVQLKRS